MSMYDMIPHAVNRPTHLRWLSWFSRRKLMQFFISTSSSSKISVVSFFFRRREKSTPIFSDQLNTISAAKKFFFLFTTNHHLDCQFINVFTRLIVQCTTEDLEGGKIIFSFDSKNDKLNFYTSKKLKKQTRILLEKSRQIRVKVVFFFLKSTVNFKPRPFFFF